MKTELIDKVVARMAQSLTPQQLYELRKSLESERSAYELTQAHDSVEKSRKDNTDLIHIS